MIFFLGLVLGTVSSFLGIGGGVFLVPLLPLIYPLTAFEAVVLSLTFIFFSVLTNTVLFQIQKKIVWTVALAMGPFIVVGGFIGSRLASQASDIFLRSFLCLFLLLMSFNFLRALISLKENPKATSLSLLSKISKPGLGLFAGLLSGFAGVGSGVFLNWLVLKDPSVGSKNESPTVNAMMIFVCSGVFVSALWTEPKIFLSFYEKVGFLSGLLILVGIITGAFLGRALNAKGFAKARLSLLFLITFTLSVTVFVETYRAIS